VNMCQIKTNNKCITKFSTIYIVYLPDSVKIKANMAICWTISQKSEKPIQIKAHLNVAQTTKSQQQSQMKEKVWISRRNNVSCCRVKKKGNGKALEMHFHAFPLGNFSYPLDKLVNFMGFMLRLRKGHIKWYLIGSAWIVFWLSYRDWFTVSFCFIK